MVFGDPAIFETQRGGIGHAQTHLVFASHHGHARGALGHHEGFDRGFAQAFIQGRPYHHRIATIPGSGEDFLAIQYVLIAIQCGGGFHRGGIGTGFRFGDGHGDAHFAEFFFLLRCAHRRDSGIPQTGTRDG